MYLALYRKFRPGTFDEFVGQEHVTKTLTNQIKSGQISHAYLFCGSRGTGKTSAAKVFARAVNCLSNKNGSPCGKCAACKALIDESSMDIIEIDAASNNRVDEVREIRDNAKYPPVNAKYKVYIIDEVHMLTESAANALLKTLEEPPKHAVFILATTEPHKLPATILSRVLRFDFKLLSKPDLEKLLIRTFKQAEIKCEEAALKKIASAGEGSVRDALSIADMCAAYSSNDIKYDDVITVLGASDRQTLTTLAQKILAGDVGGFLTQINKISENGKNLTALTKDLAGFFRDVIVVKTTKDAPKILELPKDDFETLAALAAGDLGLLNTCMQAFSKAGLELKYSTDPLLLITAVGMELMLGEVSKKKPDLIISQAAGNPAAANPQTKKLANEKTVPHAKAEAVARNEAETQNTNKDAAGDPGHARTIWGKVLLELEKRELFLLHPVCGKIDRVALNGTSFYITANSAAEEKLLKKESNLGDLVDTFRALKYNYNVIINFKEETQKTKTKEELLQEKLGAFLEII